jgi:hypothetical protein
MPPKTIPGQQEPPASAPATPSAEPLADGARGKVLRTGIRRDDDYLYYVSKGDVWRTPKVRPGKPKGAPEKLTSVGIEMEIARYIYYIDQDGDIARIPRKR